MECLTVDVITTGSDLDTGRVCNSSLLGLGSAGEAAASTTVDTICFAPVDHSFAAGGASRARLNLALCCSRPFQCSQYEVTKIMCPDGLSSARRNLVPDGQMIWSSRPRGTTISWFFLVPTYMLFSLITLMPYKAGTW